MANNLTRINNNQISTASTGNVYLGINAASKVQSYTITSALLANNLTYGSDLTVTGNLTVQGTTTAVNTVNTLISDPLIVLADGQTTGTPTVDIGYIGLRGSQDNIALAWKEADSEIVAAFTTTESGNVYSNTTFSITSYANFHANDVTANANLSVTGTTSLQGNIISDANVTGTITGGNLYTAGEVSATGNITANASSFFVGNGSQLTGVAATSVDANNLIGNTLSSNVIYSSLTSVGTLSSLSVSGDVTGGNLYTGGNVSATGNVTGANFTTTGSSGNITGANNIVATTISGTATVIGGNLSTGGTVTATGTVTGGNIATGGTASATGTVTGGNIATGGYVSATGNVTGGNVYTGGEASATGTVTGGNLSTGGTVTATGTVTGGNIATGGTASATGTVTGGNLSTGGTVTATGNVTGGNILTSGLVSAQGNITGGNVITDYVFSTNSSTTLTVNAATISLNPTGNVGLNSRWINNLADPTADQDAATKIYVDTVAQGLDAKASVSAATTTWIANVSGVTNVVYNNGTSGVGATITVTTTSQLSLDTIDLSTLAANSRVLIKNETAETDSDAAWNGIYVVTSTGTLATVLTRSADFNQPAEMYSAFTFVTEGSINGDTGWVCTNNDTSPITVGTTPILFSQFSGAGSYSAGNALSLNGTQFNVNIDTSGANTIAINGSNELYIPTGATLTNPNITAATGTSLSVTGSVTGGNVYTGGEVSATGTVTGGNVSTSGFVTATGNVTGGNVYTGGESSATGNVTGGNLSTGGTVTATGTITGGNLSTGGTVTATGTITGGNVYTAGEISATGNITANASSFFVGNGSMLTGVTATGVDANNLTGNTLSSNVIYSSLTSVGTLSSLSATGDITVTGGNIATDGTVSATGTVTGGNVYTGGDSSATGTVTGGNLSTGGTVTATGTITGGNVETSGYISATGNITGGNITITGEADLGNIVISGDNITDTNGRVNFNTALGTVDFAVNGTTANVFYVNATTNTASFGSNSQTTDAIVAFNASDSILIPTGNIGQRPATGVTGMLRFNTTNNSVEVYNNSEWQSVGATIFTVIADEQFYGDGSTVNFTLGSTQTTQSCIVAINGVVQIPTTAYSVSGVDPTCVLTFTEAPEIGDVIDVREITTTTTVTKISNQNETAVVGTSSTGPTVLITGDVIPTGNASQSLGNATNQWSSLHVAGNTIYLGTNQLKSNGGVFSVYESDGTTLANIGAAGLSVTSITDGTSAYQFAGVNGNAIITAGAANTLTVTSTGTVTSGTASVTGNITGSYIIGNGSQLTGLPAGYTNSNTATFLAAFGSNTISTTGTITSGNITGSNVLTGGLISATSTITSAANVIGGNLTTAGQVSATANITGGNILTGGLISATTTITSAGNITGGNLNTTGTATIGGFTISGNTIVSAGATLTLDPNASGGVDGLVVIAGNLQVNGNTTTINSNVVSTNDLTINFANNAINGSAANGGGIEVGPIGSPYQTWTYNNTGNLWAASAGISAIGNITGGNLTTGGQVAATANITGGNILTGGLISATTTITGAGNITGGNLLTAGTTGLVSVNSITHTGSNAVGNIGASGSAFNYVYATTFSGVSTTAQYADLAEKYLADAVYEAGTVLDFGGELEVTQSSQDMSTAVAGVVSTEPGVIMNQGLEGDNVVTVAFTGRVPCKVTGSVSKGDLMVSNGDGTARSEANPKVGTVIGKSLANFTGDTGVIEVVVGRF